FHRFFIRSRGVRATASLHSGLKTNRIAHAGWLICRNCLREISIRNRAFHRFFIRSRGVEGKPHRFTAG
ncbi:MAG: hypothetical protein WA705_08425, partial [Candidatus Ozemobacteraceae bacterium]